MLCLGPLHPPEFTCMWERQCLAHWCFLWHHGKLSMKQGGGWLLCMGQPWNSGMEVWSRMAQTPHPPVGHPEWKWVPHGSQRVPYSKIRPVAPAVESTLQRNFPSLPFFPVWLSLFPHLYSHINYLHWNLSALLLRKLRFQSRSRVYQCPGSLFVPLLDYYTFPPTQR